MNAKEKLHNKLTPIYQELEDIENEWNIKYKYDKTKLISTYEAQVGNSFPMKDYEGILFYGRSNNGWDRTDPNGDGEGTEFDMSKIKNESNKRPFYKLIYNITKSMYPKCDQCYNNIAISNITKLVFCSRGNPDEELWQYQFKYLEKIIETEINILSPKIIILITGNTIKRNYEKPFFDLYKHKKTSGLNIIEERVWGEHEGKQLKATIYNEEKRLIILTDRPEILKSQENIKKHSDTICELIKKHLI